jgi:hypothetical protein
MTIAKADSLQDACVSFARDLACTALDEGDVDDFLSARQVYGLCVYGDCQSVVALGNRFWAINAVAELVASTETLEQALAALDDPFCLMEGVDGIHCDGMSSDEIAARLTWVNEPADDELFTINGETWRYFVETGTFARQEPDGEDLQRGGKQPMRFDYFFTGKLGREEAASAFLAMALDDSPAFRTYFLRCAGVADAVHALDWAVVVEDDRVDVTLRAPAHVVLVENKIDAGAVTPGQLLGYYETEVARAGDRPITVVFLSPEGVGSREVGTVSGCPTLLTRCALDRVTAVSWQELLKYNTTDGEAWIRSGLEAVERAIERANTAMYPPVGSRLILRQTADAAARLLRPLTQANVRRWSAKHKEALIINGLPLTINAWVQFTCEDREGAPVTSAPDEQGNWTLSLHTKLKPRGDLKTKSAVRQWWREQCLAGGLALSPGLALTPVGGEWLGSSQPFQGNSDALSQALVDLALRVVGGASEQLATAGLHVDASAATERK